LIGLGRDLFGGGGLAIDPEIGGEEAVQPSALLRGERRGLRDQRGNGCHGVHAASARNGAQLARSRSAAISCRRQNAKNDSAGVARWASQAASSRSSKGGKSSNGTDWAYSRAIACSAVEAAPPPI